MVSDGEIRAYYAKLIAGRAGTTDERLIEAFGCVERERFVGPGPWKVYAQSLGYIETPSDDLSFLYADVLIGLVADRTLNNGEPHLHARCLAALKVQPGEAAIHIGAGTGYYTAILAHLVSETGVVVAYEIDPALAGRAASNLECWPQVSVEARSGTDSLVDSDIIYVSAGATRPLDAWLDPLRVGGRLLFPLTPAARGIGGMLLITRTSAATFDACFVSPAMFIPCEGARDPDEAERLGDAFSRGGMYSVKSFHRRTPADETSWFIGDGWWLSTRANPGGKSEN